MLENIFQTTIKESNTIFLHMPTEQYLFKYSYLNKNNVQKLVKKYFGYKGKDIKSKLKDIDDSIHNIKIMLEIS